MLDFCIRGRPRKKRNQNPESSSDACAPKKARKTTRKEEEKTSSFPDLLTIEPKSQLMTAQKHSIGKPSLEIMQKTIEVPTSPPFSSSSSSCSSNSSSNDSSEKSTTASATASTGSQEEAKEESPFSSSNDSLFDLINEVLEGADNFSLLDNNASTNKSNTFPAHGHQVTF